jgi:hypothetical protein
MNAICAQATSGQLAAGRLSQRESGYQHLRPMSSDLHTTDGVALGLLLLRLQRPDLSPELRRCGWIVAEKWAGDYVGTKHRGQAV